MCARAWYTVDSTLLLSYLTATLMEGEKKNSLSGFNIFLKN